jgi:hypothetical protein
VKGTNAARGRCAGACATAALTMLLLAGCGGSSGSSSTTASAPPASTAAATTPAATTPAATTPPVTGTTPTTTAAPATTSTTPTPTLPSHIGQTVSADVYLTSVCTTLGSWKNTVQGAVTQFDHVLSSEASDATPAQVTPVLSSFIAQVGNATIAVVTGLGEAGSPKVRDGAKLEKALTLSFGHAVSVLRNAQTQIAHLPTAPAAFGSAASHLGKTVENSLTSLAATFRSLESSALKQAAAHNRACEALKTS